MKLSDKRAALENEATQIYDAALKLAKRAEKLARKARAWGCIDTAEDVGGFGATLDGAARDYLWHRCPNR